ncbi:desaturase [Rhodoferax lacus]|uniref:Desaturase n=1 Tax=Rhodoferax lacus TaxID=2184758 RepID=A0A3E1RHU5_9BURK|nr:hydroxysqualene dehydroxylase HpnE [Rhodoferax lacus]RFO98976.1 desaturase [Rhodoferax lacus]
MQVAVVGGGWAGMAAAVTATEAGHRVTVFEATRTWGGRARAMPTTLPDGSAVLLDNGQHILIGAYADTLALMRTVGVDPKQALLRLPLTLLFPDGLGLQLPDWPMPLDVLGGIWSARGWSVADKWSLLRTTSSWQMAGFRCATATTVTDLCRGLAPKVIQTLIEPLCVSALNTPPERSSGQVFLRVLKDSLLSGRGSSNLLLPRTDLSALFPDAAAAWLGQRGASLRPGCRVEQLELLSPAQAPSQWRVNDEAFDAVLWATSPSVASQLLGQARGEAAPALQAWALTASQLQHEGIATVYLQAGSTRLPQPMLALRSSAECPAQFVFDRGQLDGPAGLLAFVVSASTDERAVLQGKVLQQAQAHLGGLLRGSSPVLVQTVLEKRATFACTPGLQRPAQHIAPGLLACGDYVDGPYPATLEGAVQSGKSAALALA